VNIFSWAIIGLLATLIWPVNIPLMALAYKVRIGQQPIPFEPLEYWLRSTFAALGMALLGWLLLVGFGSLLWLEMPPSYSLAIVALIYVPIAVLFLFWIMAFDEIMEAISLFLIYLFLPGLPLVLIFWFFGLSQKVAGLVS
jgi:hypothetical protein